MWFKNDPRVANVKVTGGVLDRAVMDGVVATVNMFEEQIKTLPPEQQEAALAEVAASVQAGMPPRENPRINTSLDSVYATGPLGRAHCVIHGNCNYKQTGAAAGLRGLLAAAAAAAADRACLGLPGLRAPRAARRAAQLRAGARSGPDTCTTDVSLTDYLDKGASLGPDAPCLTLGTDTLSYGEVQELCYPVAGALAASGVRAGDKVGDPVRATTRSRSPACSGSPGRGAVWCPINPRNEAAENRELLDLFDCSCLIFQSAFAPLVQEIAPQLPQLSVLVCLDADLPEAPSLHRWLSDGSDDSGAARFEPPDDVVMIVGTGGTTGRPKGVVLTGRNIETMSALTLMGYPFDGRPVYLALAPLTHAAGVLCFPIMALGGRVIVMAKPDLAEFLALVAAPPRHAHLPATDPDLHAAGARGPRRRPTSARCSASGTARRRCRRPGWRRRSPGSGR